MSFDIPYTDNDVRSWAYLVFIFITGATNNCQCLTLNCLESASLKLSTQLCPGMSDHTCKINKTIKQRNLETLEDV